jgi:hypothetical protein
MSGAAHYRQALAIAEAHGIRPLIAHCRFGLARIDGRVGEPGGARDNLSAATTMYREMGMDFWLEQALSAAGSGEARQFSGAV